MKRSVSSVVKAYRTRRNSKVQTTRFKKLAPISESFNDPAPITEDDIDRGMFNLVNTGKVPNDVDLTPAFEKGSAPVTVKSA